MFFFIFGCWLLSEKFSFCPKNNGFARVWGLQPSNPLARTPMLLAELQDMGHATRPKSGTSTSYENALWTIGMSWISVSSTKSLESGERHFELVWL